MHKQIIHHTLRPFLFPTFIYLLSLLIPQALSAKVSLLSLRLPTIVKNSITDSLENNITKVTVIPVGETEQFVSCYAERLNPAFLA